MKLFVVGDSESSTSRVRAEVTRLGYVCPPSNVLTVAAATSTLSGQNADITLVVVNDEHAPVFETLGTGIDWGTLIAVGPSSNGKLVLQALRSGAAEFVDIDELTTDLAATIQNLQNQGDGGSKGRLVAVCSAGGGAGASTLAANLAVLLASPDAPVALLDLRLTDGAQAALLDLTPEHSLTDLTESKCAQLDLNVLQSVLSKHDSGVRLLAPPDSYTDMELLTAERISEVVELCRSSFAYVVVDLNHPVYTEQSEVLTRADDVLLLFRTDVPSLQNAQRILEYLTQMGIDRERIELIAGRAGQPMEVAPAKAADALGMAEFATIPNDLKSVNLATNGGTPLVLQRPSSKPAKAMKLIANRIRSRAESST
jgi:pilus assembly protein CpaE